MSHSRIPCITLSDRCSDVGRRLAEYIESEPLRKKAQQEAQRAKLEALEKKLGIVHSADGSSSSAEPLAGKKHRLDDTEYLEQSREIVDNVKNAVSVGEYSPQVESLASTELVVSYVEEEEEGEGIPEPTS